MPTFAFDYSGLDETARDNDDTLDYTLVVSEPDESDARQMVLRELLGAVVSGACGTGERLPSETELADTFRVSRSSVREALFYLRALGLVEIQEPVAPPTVGHTISQSLAIGLWIIVGALLTYGIITTVIDAGALFTG